MLPELVVACPGDDGVTADSETDKFWNVDGSRDVVRSSIVRLPVNYSQYQLPYS